MSKKLEISSGRNFPSSLPELVTSQQNKFGHRRLPRLGIDCLSLDSDYGLCFLTNTNHSCAVEQYWHRPRAQKTVVFRPHRIKSNASLLITCRPMAAHSTMERARRRQHHSRTGCVLLPLMAKSSKMAINRRPPKLCHVQTKTLFVWLGSIYEALDSSKHLGIWVTDSISWCLDSVCECVQLELRGL